MESDDKRDGSGYDYRRDISPVEEVVNAIAWGKIDFPRMINHKEARGIVRHITFHVEDCYVDLHTSRNEHFGDRFVEKIPSSPKEVQSNLQGIHLEGVVQRTREGMARMNFSFRQTFDRGYGVGYEGMQLNFGIYDWDEMDGHNQQLAKDIKDVVGEYFGLKL